uniref:Uncharacterized protein n=1 Tax=Anguilla anguilla TaxID=7936 RepID=A0A0E9QR44_ANGAN
MSVLIHFSMNVKTHRPSLHLCYSVKTGRHQHWPIWSSKHWLFI